MKKTILLLFALISILVFTLAGCSNNDTFTEKSYCAKEGEVEKVAVQVTDREVEISASEDNRIYIDYFDGEKEYLEISVTESKELTVKLTTNKHWTDFIGTKPSKEYRKIKLRIPDNLISTLSASTTNESIKLNPLSISGNISLYSNGGDIEFERLNVGKTADMTVKNGSIKGTLIGGWDDFAISCKIKKGNCNLPALKEGGEKSFFADCNNGNINIEFSL